MATGIESNFIVACSSGFSVRVRYHETYDITANTSDLYIDGLDVKSTKYSDAAYYCDGIIKVNGTAVKTMTSSSGNYKADVVNKNAWYTVSGASGSVKGIAHNQDGSKTVKIELLPNRYSKFAFYSNDSGKGSGWGIASYSETITLTTIPRAATITLTTQGTIYTGGEISLQIDRKSEAYTHSLSYAFKGNTGTLLEKSTETTAELTVPDEWAESLTDAASAACTFTCTTYNGDTVIGTTTLNVTINIPETIVPVIESVVLSGATAAGYLQNYSKINVKTTATGQSGATISAISVNIAGQTLTGDDVTADVIRDAGDVTITVTVTDSRGRTADTSQTATIVAYDPPTFDIEVDRCDESGEWYSGGAYARVSGTVSYTVLSGNECTVTVSASSTKTETLDDSGTVEIVVDADTDSVVTVTITANDGYSTTVKTVEIESTNSYVDFGTDGISATFGGKNERDGWDVFKLPVEFKKDVQVNGFRLFLMPGDEPDQETAMAFGHLTNNSSDLVCMIPMIPIMGTVTIKNLEMCARLPQGGYPYIKDADGNYDQLTYTYAKLVDDGQLHAAVNSISVSRQFGGVYFVIKLKNKLCSDTSGTTVTNNISMTFVVRYEISIS